MDFSVYVLACDLFGLLVSRVRLLDLKDPVPHLFLWGFPKFYVLGLDFPSSDSSGSAVFPGLWSG